MLRIEFIPTSYGGGKLTGVVEFHYNSITSPPTHYHTTPQPLNTQCTCEATLNHTVFSPVEGQQHLPQEMSNPRYHQVATHIVDTYLRAKLGVSAYIWTQEETHAQTKEG